MTKEEQITVNTLIEMHRRSYDANILAVLLRHYGLEEYMVNSYQIPKINLICSCKNCLCSA